MGKSNQQRRTAKAMRRHQRRATPPPRRQTGADEFLSKPNGTPLAAEQRRQEALELLSTLARYAGALPATSLWGAVHGTLSGREPAVLSVVEGLLVAELMARVSAAWEGGWQPQDLRHAAAKRGARQGLLAAELVTRQALVTGASRRAPEGWRDQLDLVAATLASEPTPTREWRPVTAPVAQGVETITAWVDALGLLKTLAELPGLPILMPPPSRWDTRVHDVIPTDAPERDRILLRIRALLSKAEATDHSAEAEAFTAKAQELMSRHSIDDALLHARREESVSILTRRMHLGSPYASTKVLLLTAVGRANRTRVIYLEQYAIAHVVGTPVDVDQVELLYTSLLIQATRAVSAAGHRGAGSFERSPTFRRSFLTAYADRIGERLTEADEETMAGYGAQLVPVLQRQATAIDTEFTRHFPHTKALNTGFLDARGWHAGREAADRAVFVAGRLTG
jgi:hypothetical protein